MIHPLVLATALAVMPPGAVPARFQDVARRADAARLANDAAGAIRLYKEAVALRPPWIEGWWYLGTLTYDLDLHAEARDAFRRFVALKPDGGGAAWAFLGFCEFRLGEYETALEHLERGQQLGLGQPEQLQNVARYHAGILYTRFGKFDQAWLQLEALAKRGDESPQVVDAMGIAMLRLPLLPQEVAPEQREFVQLAGRAAYAQAAQRLEAAKLAYGELLSRYGEKPNVHYGHGVFLLHGDADAALQEFERELQISPGHVDARLQIAYEYLKRGEYELGLPYAQEAVRLSPNLYTARNAYGRLLLGKGDVPGAIRELEAAVALAPGSAPVRFGLQNAYAQAGRTEDAKRERGIFQEIEGARRAISDAENQVRASPQDPAAHRALADAYARGWRKEDAQRELRLAERLEERARSKAAPGATPGSRSGGPPGAAGAPGQAPVSSAEQDRRE